MPHHNHRAADWVGEFDDMDTRVVLSAPFGEGQLSAKAACCQARSGAILDEDGDESVAVILSSNHQDADSALMRLTPAQARYFARNLLSAAGWPTIGGSIRRWPARAPNSATPGRTIGNATVVSVVLLFGHINAQIMKY